MEQILNYVKPELIVLTAVLYFVGVFIKKTAVSYTHLTLPTIA